MGEKMTFGMSTWKDKPHSTVSSIGKCDVYFSPQVLTRLYVQPYSYILQSQIIMTNCLNSGCKSPKDFSHTLLSLNI